MSLSLSILLFLFQMSYAMKNFLFLLLSFFLLSGCDDGDLINLDFDFDDTIAFSECNQLIIYKLNSTKTESLALSLADLALDDLFTFDETLTDVENTIVFERTIDGTTNRFNYRTYSSEVTGDALFCNPIPPSDITIIDEEESTTGTVTITVTAVDDDNDGVPSEFEDLNGNGNLFDDDSDNDGIPDFLDVDDDGDNVLTKDELNTEDTDDDPNTNPLDTDSDGTPDYLDTDDDGDNALTRDEESILQDQNPLNDVTNNAAGPDYLNPDVATAVTAVAFRAHNVVRTYTVKVEVTNIQFSFLTQTYMDFGEDVSSENKEKTPEFN